MSYMEEVLNILKTRAVRVQLYCGSSILSIELLVKYSINTGHVRCFSFKFAVQQRFEMSQKYAGNASEILLKQCCNPQNSHLR